MCLHLLSIVDDTLEALGTSKEYHRFHNNVFRLTIAWFMGVIVINILDVSLFSYEYYFAISRIFVPFVGNHLLHVTALCSLTWTIILQSVYFLCLKLLYINICINVKKLQNYIKIMFKIVARHNEIFSSLIYFNTDTSALDFTKLRSIFLIW